MSEPTPDLFANARPITLRNLCAAGCGQEHSPAGKAPGVMVPEIGMVCERCVLPGAEESIAEHPKKLMSIPSYKVRNL